jgi:pimeloyl-ACP methyl ester carboxylesterase
MNFVEKKISIDGMAAYYIESGEGTDVFFFIPGWAAHPTAYLKFLTLISKNYRVISPYPPGFGRSFTPEKLWSTKEYAAFFTKMIEELSLKRVTLCAHSSASSFTAQTAAQNSHIKKTHPHFPIYNPS